VRRHEARRKDSMLQSSPEHFASNESDELPQCAR
jgi:hypothetical protein